MKKVVIIGAGAMAKEHVRAFCAIDTVDMVGCFNRTREKAVLLSKEFDISYVADSIQDLYEQCKPDLVIVAVNILSAKPVLMECIAQGVPILTEKPIALDLAESQEILDLAKKNDCKIWVGLNRRCYCSTRTALDDLDQFEDQRIIQVYDQQDLEVARKLGHPEEVVSNWMYANSIHLVDYLRVFGRGDVVSVAPVNSWMGTDTNVVTAKIVFSSGDIGLYHSVWGMPGPWACIVTTAQRRWEMKPLEQAVYQTNESRAVHTPEMDEIDVQFKAGFKVQADEIISCLEENKPVVHVADLEEAFKTTELVAQIFG